MSCQRICGLALIWFLTIEWRRIQTSYRPCPDSVFPWCATGKQLLPLSSSMHGGVSQLAWQQHTGEPNNLVRMRSQSFGQSAPSLTAGLVSTHAHTPSICFYPTQANKGSRICQNASGNVTNARKKRKKWI